MNTFISFDKIRPRLGEILRDSALSARELPELWVVRDLMGRIRLLLPKQPEPGPGLHETLDALKRSIHERLGAHSHEPEQGLVFIDDEETLKSFRAGAIAFKKDGVTVYLVDRLVTGSEWATVEGSPSSQSIRFTLFSIKGGVGRSTTTAVLAAHLARKGRRVLVVDLDLESPGVSSMLLAHEEYPDFGVVDWFVEDLVGQGDAVIREITGRPEWSKDLRGDVLVVPAYGKEPGEYLAKLGRVFLDRPPDQHRKHQRWTKRLLEFICALERNHEPDVVLLDSRSGLHDVAAAAVTDVQAQVLLFAMDNPATWTGYRVLFEHWRSHEVAPEIRNRLSLVAALVPVPNRTAYLKSFRERGWDLFRSCLYDEVPVDGELETETDPFSFDLAEDDAPHHAFTINWSEGLAALSSLRDLEDGSAIDRAYYPFLGRFDQFLKAVSGAHQ
jgi:Mrp family chromosome partitioning ATPase